MRLVVLLFTRLSVLLMLQNSKFSVNSCTEKTSNENIPKGYFSTNIEDYEVIIPKKVSSNGEMVSNYLPHFYENDSSRRKNRREIFSGTDPVHYNIPINGKTINVRLTPNQSPFPSSMIIEHQTPQTSFNIGKTRFRKPEKHNCHFKGEIVNDPGSKVTLSTCNGLAGHIQSKEGDYLIEPVRGSNPSNGEHPHILYRKADDRINFKGGNCIVKAKHKVPKTNEEEMRQEDTPLQKELIKLKSNKQILTPMLQHEKKNYVSSNKGKVTYNGAINEGANDSDDDDNDNDIEIVMNSTDSFLLLPDGRKSRGDKLSKTRSSVTGRNSEENLDGIKKDIDSSKIPKKGYQSLNMKETENHLKKSLYAKENHNKELKKTKKMKSVNFDDVYSKSLPSVSYHKNKNSFNGAKEIKKSNSKLSNRSNSEESGDEELFHEDSKNLFLHNSINDNGFSVWDNVVKTMQMKDEDDKNEVENKENEYNDLNKENEYNFLSNENSKHSQKTKAKQNAKFVSKNERKQIYKRKVSSTKYSDVNNFTNLDHDSASWNRRLADNKIMEETGNKYLNNNSETQFSDNYLYLDRDIGSGYLNDGLKNMTESDKTRRAIQYKSCKPKPQCRNKTECSWDLRLLVVISYQFSQRHKDIDLETYILTVVNLVSRNFHDASLGILLNVKLVRMVFIEYNMEELDEDKNSLEKVFENFCVFQYRINPHKMDHPNHHDIAVYIVSFQECGGNKIYGVTYSDSICRAKQSCIVSKDEGLLLGNIITHQIGHSLGADHDDGGQGSCQPYEPDGSAYYHMAPMITMNSTQWSRCSSDAIQRFLRNNGDRCLEYISEEIDFDWPNVLPGQIYNAVQQCALNFHMKTLPCYTGDFCKFLYCQATKTECVSLLVPPADGTLCASGMWCVRGSCVTKGRHPGMVNGEWSNWGPWSRCSRSCGGGVQHSFRVCNNPPPALGGRYCVGSRLRYLICNADIVCERYSPSFREFQCKETNRIPFRGKFFTWQAFHSQFEYMECALLCESNTGIVAVRELVAADGTPCKPGTKNVCIQGKCADVGCDWKINSGCYRDACGVCHGNGSECRVIQGVYDEKDGKGYVPFLKVPKGSGMIYVRELNPSSVLVAVASYNTDYFYLNGPEEAGESNPAEYDFGGVKGFYSIKGKMERIFIPDPTDEDLIFYIKYSGKDHNPGIRYQFAVRGMDKNYIPSYSWQFLDWNHCSDVCGGGQQKAVAKCVEDQGGIVEGRYCLQQEKPKDIIRSCNEFPCVPKWWVGAWSDCVQVANERVRYRSVLCMRTRDPSSLRNEILKDKYCCDEEKPDTVRRCNETVEEGESEYCRHSKGKCELPSIYNLEDLHEQFADLEDLPTQILDNSDGNNDRFDRSVVSFDEGEELPLSDDDEEIALNGYRIEESKENSVLKSLTNKTVAKEFKKETKDQTIPSVNQKNLEVAFNDDGKKRSGKFETYHHLDTKEENTLIPFVNQPNSTYLKKKNSQINETESSNKAMGMAVEHYEPDRRGVQKLVAAQPKVKTDDNNFQNKFGGTTCTVRVVQTKKFSPLHLPNETTCTTKCTTCPYRIQFTVPQGEALDIRPPCPVIDSMIVNDFIISIIPILCKERNTKPTDMYLEVFHESGSWPHGLEANKTIIKGQRALFYLSEIRENATRLPFVFHAEN